MVSLACDKRCGIEKLSPLWADSGFPGLIRAWFVFFDHQVRNGKGFEA